MIRCDFVSNSSSSSFVLKTKENINDPKFYTKFLECYKDINETDEEYLESSKRFNENEYLIGITNWKVCNLLNIHYAILNEEDTNEIKNIYIPASLCIRKDKNFNDFLNNIEYKFLFDGLFWIHEDNVFDNRSIAIINQESIDYTKKILDYIKENKDKFVDYEIIDIGMLFASYKNKNNLSLEEAYKVLDDFSKHIKGFNILNILTSYSGDAQRDGHIFDESDNKYPATELINKKGIGEYKCYDF